MISLKKYKLLIDGQWQKSKDGEYFDSVNPSNGEVIAKLSRGSSKDAKDAIAAAREAFDDGSWSNFSVKQRGAYLVKIAQLIRENAKELADCECLDTGKTIKQTTFIDVPTCADTFEYFGNIEKELNEKELSIPAPVKSRLLYEPVGVVGQIIPWNYPLIMFAWKVAPALITGNTIVFKPSRLASVSILRLAEIIQQVNLPKGVLNIITGGSEVGSELAVSDKVDMISFTGGTETGKDIIKVASNNTKKMSMELGGKSPNIVFADCDMEAAIGGTMSAIFMNQGQMCTAGSRLILDDKIYDDFLKRLVEKTKNLKIGSAIDYTTDFGPMVSKEQRDYVLSFIEKGKKNGAKILYGGKIPEGEELTTGFFIEPTIFVDVKNDMFVAKEEAFGPVLSVIKFSKMDEAVAIANDTKYGLASCIWTKDLDKANNVAKQLRCGTVWINTYGGFYNEAPFGGYKQSGFGRELGIEGLLEYTQVKHVCADVTPGGKPLVSSWF